MASDRLRQVRVLINPKSGFSPSFGSVQRALQSHWDVPGIELTYQVSKSAKDGGAKARRAAEQGVDTVLVVGGDGMVNSIGSVLIGTDTVLGVIPTGSGNGFARHFGIPLSPENAARALIGGTPRRIDVGVVNGHPFFVTCSMAWDAAIVRSFERSPFRGIVPYIFAGAYEFLEYTPQPIDVVIDSGRRLVFADPLVFTVANLTQYGGGARIAPNACEDDGALELVVALHQDVARLLGNITRLFDGTINDLPEVVSHRFRRLAVHRERTAPIQVDGELLEVPADFAVHVHHKGLQVLLPAGKK